MKSAVNMLQQSEYLNIMNTATCMGDINKNLCVGSGLQQKALRLEATPFYNTCNQKSYPKYTESGSIRSLDNL